MFAQSVTSCNETIKRRTKKFFDKSRRLTSIFSNSINVNESPVMAKLRKSFHRSPKASPCTPESPAKNTFESKAKVVTEHATETPKPLKIIRKFSTKNKPKLPPKTLEELPTKLFIDIFKFLPAENLLSLRLVSKRFDEIIQNHAFELPKISKEVLNLSHPDGNKQEIQSSRSSCKSMNFEIIDKPLRHLETRRLSLIGITVTSKLLRFLHRSLKYQLKELRFIECNFCIKSYELTILIQKWEPKYLHFNNCKWNPDEINSTKESHQKFLDDLFFSRNKSFDFLCVDFSSASSPQKLGLTADKFSKLFTDASKLPSTIIFNNCLTNITAKTLESAIQGYINLTYQKPTVTPPHQYQWSLGTVNDSKCNILKTISSFQEYIVSQRESCNKIELVFQVNINSPLLLLSIKFETDEENVTKVAGPEWFTKTFNPCPDKLVANNCKNILWEEKDVYDFPVEFL